MVLGAVLGGVGEVFWKAASWRQDGEQERQDEAFARELGGWLEALGEPGEAGTGEHTECRMLVTNFG